MKTLLLRLDDDGNQTLGMFQLFDDVEKIFECNTLELPWVENLRKISCIPEGEYKITKHNSPKFGECLWVEDVPNRSEILLHVGNYNKDTLGCILPGRKFSDINNDGLRDVTSSSNTLKNILALVPDSFKIKIISLSKK